MKVQLLPLMMFILTGCLYFEGDKYSKPTASKSGSADIEKSAGDGAGEEVTGDENGGGEVATGADEGGGEEVAGEGEEGGGAEGPSADVASLEALIIWDGSATLGKISGSGFSVDAKGKKINNIAKAVIGDLETGKSHEVEWDAIEEVLTLVKEAKDAPAKKTLAPCDKAKLMGEQYISIVRNGAEEIYTNAAFSECESKRFIDDASFAAILKHMKETYPLAASTETTAHH